MYLIAGLGNPESKYDGTRHNIGFAALDVIAKEYSIKLSKLKHKAVYGDGMIQGEKVILAKPQTYMNNSGESIRDISSFYKIPPENIIILYDDISLDVGRLRIRPKGSAGGHNGIKSIIYHLGTEVFPRVKIGVGAPPHKDYDLADYVLGHFSESDVKALLPAMKNIVGSVECIIRCGVETAMNKYNGK
jgi:PTH1 family peptidyl-tRNA hydrolase